MPPNIDDREMEYDDDMNIGHQALTSMFELRNKIQKVADIGARIAQEIGDEGKAEDFQRLDSVLDVLTTLDKDISFDIRALDEIAQEMENYTENEPILRVKHAEKLKFLAARQNENNREDGSGGGPVLRNRPRAVGRPQRRNCQQQRGNDDGEANADDDGEEVMDEEAENQRRADESDGDERGRQPRQQGNVAYIQSIRERIQAQVNNTHVLAAARVRRNEEIAAAAAADESIVSVSSTRNRVSQGRHSDSVLVAQEFISDKDPVTKQPIKDPVRNKICGHIYDREAIRGFIRQCRKGNPAQCPVRLCANKKTLDMFDIDDYQEFFHILSQQDRNRRIESDEDDDGSLAIASEEEA